MAWVFALCVPDRALRLRTSLTPRPVAVDPALRPDIAHGAIRWREIVAWNASKLSLRSFGVVRTLPPGALEQYGRPPTAR